MTQKTTQNKNKQDNIYREELMDIYKNPKHKGKMENPSISAWKKNPLCGDELTLQLKVEDGVITDAKFDGMACAVSVISASLLTDSLVGKTLKQAQEVTKDKFLDSIGLNLSTSRVKCAALAVEALNDAVNKTTKKENDN